MNSVCIDLYRRRSHVAALDERGGELFSRPDRHRPANFPGAARGHRRRLQDRARGDLRNVMKEGLRGAGMSVVERPLDCEGRPSHGLCRIGLGVSARRVVREAS